MECIFITGCTGSGKTTYAKMICENKGYDYYISSSSNDPFCDYKGQDCIILDDLRGNSFTFADLLKITDNHTATSVKSRYKNKIMECKLLIITSIHTISQFFNTIFMEQDEPITQFERRMKTYINMNIETMKIYAYDNFEQTYEFITEIYNPVREKFINENKQEKRLEFIENLLGKELKEDVKNLIGEEISADEEVLEHFEQLGITDIV